MFVTQHSVNVGISVWQIVWRYDKLLLHEQNIITVIGNNKWDFEGLTVVLPWFRPSGMWHCACRCVVPIILMDHHLEWCVCSYCLSSSGMVCVLLLLIIIWNGVWALIAYHHLEWCVGSYCLSSSRMVCGLSLIIPEDKDTAHPWRQRYCSSLKTKTMLIPEDKDTAYPWRQRHCLSLKTKTLLIPEHKDTAYPWR